MSKSKSVNFIGYFAILISMLSVNIPSVSSKENWSQEHGGVRYQLNSCKRQPRRTIKCNFIFVNEEDYKKIFRLEWNGYRDPTKQTRIIDADGNQYVRKEFTIGNQVWNEDKFQTGAGFFLTPGIKYKSSISFRGVPDSVTNISELIIEHSEWTTQTSSYLNIPILK
jgi:hypothetical protein